MRLSKPHTQDEIIGMVIINMPMAVPLFDAMFIKHKQYKAQDRQVEARAVGMAILEALRACVLFSHEENAPNESDYAAQKETIHSANLELHSNPSTSLESFNFAEKCARIRAEIARPNTFNANKLKNK